jgi:hypothetical protein
MLRIRSCLTRIWTISKMSLPEWFQLGVTGDNSEGFVFLARKIELLSLELLA